MDDQGARPIRETRMQPQRARDVLLAALADARAHADSDTVAVLERALGEVESQSPRLATLSARELEVVRLVARGMTDKQVADELVISPRTAQSHVASALRKTGTRRRTELAALAIHAGLARPA